MRRLSLFLLTLAATLLAVRPASAALAEIGSISDPQGLNGGSYQTAVFSSSSGYVLFGSTESNFVEPLVTIFTTTPTFAALGTSSNNLFSHHYTASAIDPAMNFAYFASWDRFGFDESALVQIDTLTGVIRSSAPIPGSTSEFTTGVIDTTNHIAYFGTNSSPAFVVKIQLPDGGVNTLMTVVSSISLPSGLSALRASAIDTTNGFAYFAGGTGVAKIRLSDFSVSDSITLSGISAIRSGVMDLNQGSLFLGSYDSPGRIVEVDVSPSLQQRTTLTLSSGEDYLTSAVIDESSHYAFFGTDTSPGKVIAIRTSVLVKSGTTLTLSSGLDRLRSAAIDTTHQYAYFGTFVVPASAVKVDLLAGAPEIQTQPVDAFPHPGQSATFSIAARGRNLSYQWQRNGVDIAGETSTTLVVTNVTFLDDAAGFRCIVTGSNGTTTSESGILTVVPVVRAYPNPWRVDRHTGLPITFDGMAANSTIKIFNLAAHWVKTLPPANGTTTWDLTNDRGERVASGYYFYVVTARDDRQTVKGKIAIIK